MASGLTEAMCRFGPLRYDAGRRVLLRDGAELPLEPKIVDTLEALLERRGQVVEKSELMRRVWPDCRVEEIGMSRNISLLRKALDDEAGQYIETVPKRGYRFAAAQEAPARRVPKRWMVATGAVALLAGIVYWQFYRPSEFVPGGAGPLVAVVPPECLSPKLKRDAFPDSFVAALTPELARAKGLRLIRRARSGGTAGLVFPTADGAGARGGRHG